MQIVPLLRSIDWLTLIAAVGSVIAAAPLRPLKDKSREVDIIKHLACSVLLCSLFVGHAKAVVRVIVETPHDDSSVRQAARDLRESRQTELLLSIIEPLATADRSRMSGLPFPFSYENVSRQELDKRLGKPVEWKTANYARPSAGQDVVYPQGVKADDARGLKERAKFYELKDIGGILVFFTGDNISVSPAIVYLKTDDGFVPLRAKDDLPNRLEWELKKLREIRKWLSIPEDVELKNGEFVIKPAKE